jgi:hypothetical protein
MVIYFLDGNTVSALGQAISDSNDQLIRLSELPLPALENGTCQSYLN